MKDIKGYEGLYAVTSCGRVWSYRNQKFLSPGTVGIGYQQVNLCKDGQIKQFLIHRLVAEAYIPNPENKPTVNHKNECKKENYVNNLEWMTSQENNIYGTRLEKVKKKVYCIELGETFESMSIAAAAVGLKSVSGVSLCCRGQRETAGGYHWRYAE